jgi:hypothetical protein
MEGHTLVYLELLKGAVTLNMQSTVLKLGLQIHSEMGLQEQVISNLLTPVVFHPYFKPLEPLKKEWKIWQGLKGCSN